MCDKASIISLITTAMYHLVYFSLLFDFPAFYVNNGFNQDFDHWNTKLPIFTKHVGVCPSNINIELLCFHVRNGGYAYVTWLVFTIYWTNVEQK